MQEYILETTLQGIILGTLFSICAQPYSGTSSPARQAFLRGKSNQWENSRLLPWGTIPASQPGKLGWLQPAVSFQHWELLGKGCWRRGLRGAASHEPLAGTAWRGPGGQAAVWDVGDRMPRAFDSRRSIALLEAGSSGCSMAGSLRRCVNSLLYAISLVAG